MSHHPHALHATALATLALWMTTATHASGGESAIELKDFTERGFPPDLVQYVVTGDSAGISVAEADGTTLPCQLGPGANAGENLLSFVTDLPARGERVYTIRRGTASGPAAGSLAVEKEGNALVLRTALLAVRLPAEADRRFDPPVPASTLPAPLLGFRSGGSDWLGGSKILTDRKVRSLRISLVASGPVYAEELYELAWAEGGYYRARVRVIDRVPLAEVREEYDLNKFDGTLFWELDLARGWSPDRVETAANNGNGGGDPTGRVVPLAEFGKDAPMQYLVGDQAWGRLSHIGLFEDAARTAYPGAETMAGVVPLRKGLWRRSNAMEVHSAGPGDLRVRFPMGARHAEWSRDITSETSPFSTQEHDPDLPLTYGRRVWGLALGHPAIADPKGDRPFYQLRRIYGIVGLDRYKDFILNWPDTGTKYPRLYVDDVAAYRKALAASPVAAELLKSSYVASGDEAVAARAQAGSLAALRAACAYYFVAPEASHHGTSGNYLLAAQADDVLAWPGLPPAARAEFRARLALLTYLYEDADMMSYGNGHHHGNPNMGTARYWSGPCFLALLPDHPMFERWRAHMTAYGEYNITTQMAPGGGYFEFGAAYHMHGFARAVNGLAGFAAMQAPNLERLLDGYVAPDWRYYMNLLTPVDSRWASRMIPGMANSPPGNTGHFIEAAGLLWRRDPKLAADLLWAWQANGACTTRGENLRLAPAAAPPPEPALGSACYPGVGVVLRAHQGPRETWMLLRCGFQWSHWYVDPGHFLLYSRGAALVPFQPYQYADPSDASFDAYNTVRFGHPENTWPHGWGDCSILSTFFGGSVDYAWASTGFPDWFIEPGVSERWKNSPNVTAAGARKLDPAFTQKQGAFAWNRQVLFMKGRGADSPNYFVFRDCMTGDVPAPNGAEGNGLSSYWNLNLLGTKETVTTRGATLHADTQWPVKLELTFTGRGTALQPALHEERFQVSPHGANVERRVKDAAAASPDWVKADGSPWTGPPANGMLERHVLLRIAAPPGEGQFWVLYPRADNEPAPKIARLADGVLKITHPEGTDYAFLAPRPISVDDHDVVFEGCAGAVRVAKDAVTLMHGGGGGRVGYRRFVVEAGAAFEKGYPAAGWRKGARTEGAASVVAALPPAAGDEKAVAPGLLRSALPGGGLRYRLDGSAYAIRRDGEFQLEGRSAVVERGADGAVRFIAGGDGYVKLSAGNRGVRGCGPFDLVFTEASITGTVAGITRSLAATWPDGIVRPMFQMDGARYCAGWADDHSVGKGVGAPQFSIGFGVTAGKHTVAISEWVYPALPPDPPTRRLAL